MHYIPRLNMWSLMFRPWLAKHQRRRVPYADELLARASQRGVNYGRIRAAKKSR